MTTLEAAAYLELPVDTVRRLVRAGRLPALRSDGRRAERTIAGRKQTFTITGRLHFRRADLDAFRLAHETTTTIAPNDRAVATARQCHSAALAALLPKTRVFPA